MVPESILVFQFQSVLSAQIKYCGGQLKMMSLSRSCPNHSVFHRRMHVCVKGSAKVKLDALSPCVSLSLILSSLQTRGIRPTVLKAAVWIGFPPCVCVRVCVYVRKIHTLQNVDAGNGGGREWGEMKGKWGFVYHHSLSPCTDTACMWACWSVSYILCECRTLHHSFCHVKCCRIII